MGKKTRSKQISKSGILGQRGINLIERVVLGMGSRWTPSGPNETGIDGYIELYDPSDSTPLGRTLAVQSKAVSAFESEDGATFSYWAQRRDLEYWLAGNMPVILVVSRPDTNEAYWVSIQDCFGTSPKIDSSDILKGNGRLQCRLLSRINQGRPAIVHWPLFSPSSTERISVHKPPTAHGISGDHFLGTHTMQMAVPSVENTPGNK